MKKLVTLLLTATMVMSLAACGGGGETPAATPSDTPAASGDTIKIGYISDLTGATSLWGQAGLNGALLAVEDVNAAGGVLGKQIEVVPMDGKGEPADSVSAYKKLVEESHIVASIGTNFSSCNIPMASVADELHVPVLGTATSNELVTIDETGKLHPYSFRMCFIDSFQGTVVGTYAAKNLGYKNAALLTVAGNTYSEGVGKYIADAFEAEGGTIVAQEQCQDADTDFRAQMSNIAAKSPDVMFIVMTDYSKIALAAQQAREMGMTCASSWAPTAGTPASWLPQPTALWKVPAISPVSASTLRKLLPSASAIRACTTLSWRASACLDMTASCGWPMRLPALAATTPRPFATLWNPPIPSRA